MARKVQLPENERKPGTPLLFNVHVEPFGSKRLIVALYTTVVDEDGENAVSGDTMVLSLN